MVSNERAPDGPDRLYQTDPQGSVNYGLGEVGTDWPKMKKLEHEHCRALSASTGQSWSGF